MEGTVKWFNDQKKYGFIAGEDGKDYFVHLSAIKSGTHLDENDRVSFDTMETERGVQAQNVTILEKSPNSGRSPRRSFERY